MSNYFVNWVMNVQYLSDDKGHVTAVQVGVEDWQRLKLIHPDIDDTHFELPQWQMQLLDKRLKAIEEYPELVRPISELLDIR